VSAQAGTVVVIEDDPHIADLVDLYLRRDGYRVLLARDGAQGLRTIDQEEPWIVILDVGLPGDLDGFAVCRAIRAKGSLPVLFLTARDDEVDRVLGLELGADDYLVKPFSFSELLARIRALLRRPVLRTANKLATGDISMDLSARTVTRGAQEIVLTPREFAVLEYLLRHPGQALSRSQIAERVWSWEFHGETNIVDVYIGYLRRKLDEAGAPSAIETLRGYGYRLRDEARCA
jgi:DNA-binding response OmpR family regulator